MAKKEMPANAAERSRSRGKRNVVLRTVLLVLLALGVGFGVGVLVSPHMSFSNSSQTLAGRTTVAEDELDAVMGTYAVDDVEIPVTVREAIEETSSIEAVKNSDGTYDLPSVDAVLSIARNRILEQDAQQRGIEASDEDVTEYAEEILGTDDFAKIAAGYHMGAEQTKELLKRSTIIKKLRDEVVTTESPSTPNPPEPEDEEKRDEPTEGYASYIIKLAGDEWDANANTWAREDGPFRTALADYTISNDAATFAAAQAAYYVAYERYAAAQQQISSEWTNYVNEALSNVNVRLSSLVA